VTRPDGRERPAGPVDRRLRRVLEEKGAGYLVLLDPDRMEVRALADLAQRSEEHGVDALLVGSSITLKPTFAEAVAAVRERVSVPVIIFPGNAFHVVPGADAVFFLSLLSGRNPQLLVGEQVKAAPLIKSYGLEAIPIGYLLVDSGERTSVEFMSATMPIPRDKPDIAMAHALAAQYFGMRYVFMDGGSGGRMPAPVDMVRSVSEYVDIPLIIGGGIRLPEEAGRIVEAGAGFVVTGNVLEEDGGRLVQAFAEAVHDAGRARAAVGEEPVIERATQPGKSFR
jgi:phosphoglycerol geranylgeranyltransferase